MIYLDSAATTIQKPPGVAPAMINAMNTMASPGRGGHKAAMRAADAALDARILIAELLGVDNPENVVFTYNATHALNIAIHSLVSKDDTVVISGFEHNSVTRPLNAIGAKVRVASAPMFDPQATIRAFHQLIHGASAVICTHVSNVFGYILPIEEIACMCRRYRVPLIIDASQSAGVLDIDFNRLGAEFAAMPGHKSLLGPQGTGVLLCRNGAEAIIQGGTGSNSASPDMPPFLPDRLEAGTHNITGIAGLAAGVRYIKRIGTQSILAHERELTRLLARQLSPIPGVRVFLAPNLNDQAGVLSITVQGSDSELIAEKLGARSVAVRAGLHCSPLSHKTARTFDTGTVRYSVSPFNTRAQVMKAAEVTAQIIGNL